MSFDCDVIVVGGGHAGTEAAAISARLSARTLLLTSNLETIGQMSCNPAIGGIAKGTVVREVDALGGLMGRAADRATIQFRMLNRSKGPAVWAPRAQCDRTLYRRAVRQLLESFPTLELAQGMVSRLLLEGTRVAGVETADGRTWHARAVVLTAGTFLRGRIHVGTDTQIPAGRAGDEPAVAIAQHIESLGLTVARFKTGTPPRVDGRSVDWSRVARQDGDGVDYRFSFYERLELPVNGLSTSLPVAVQLEVLHAVPGLEHATLTRPGYAIEYDYYPPTQLTPWLETKPIEHLFFAGQINGTTGYEEAAAQGVVAGINAARRGRDGEPVVLGRDDAYLGVLVDDLVTRGVDEPYRLFTSRSEFRLLLRQDNVLRRLVPLAARLGLLSVAERATAERRLKQEDDLLAAARATTIAPRAAAAALEPSGTTLAEPERVASVARRPGVSLGALLQAAGVPIAADDQSVASAEIELKYDGYLAREREAAARLAELAAFVLPADLPYLELKSLATEARQKLDRVRPSSLAQAARIPGVSPSDLHNLVVEAARRRRHIA